MDARTPPIPTKHREREEERNRRSKGRDKSPELVSLPPLTSLPENGTRQFHQRGSQNPSEPRAPPFVNSSKREYWDAQRPAYRVLEIGATPLMHACQQGDRSRVLRLLRERRETLGYRDRALRSALHYCMDAGTAGAVASAAPDLVNASDAEGHTPLHLAVIAGDAQLVAVLLANGANVNAKDSEGHGVLHWATVCGEAECARLVLAAGARPSSPDLRGGSPLHYAAQCCGAATATTRLTVPKRVGLKVLGTLLEFGADVNARDEDGRQPILWAASAGSVEAILALARAGGSAAAGATDKDGLTALHCAASRGHASCVEALVNLCGCHPDHVDDNGCSALHYAATLGHAEATALLLRLGADPNRRDRRGRTPALCAAAKGQLETLKMVVHHGASLQAHTVRGTGLAHEAVLSGRAELIEWLAEKRPGILDLATQEGKTPLHVAALHGHLDICKVLLDHGARVNAVLRTSKNGPMTALDAALYRAHRDCAKLLQMHGGMTARNLGKRDTSSPDRRPPATAVFESHRGKHNADSSNDETSHESIPDRRRRDGRRQVDGCHTEGRSRKRHDHGVSRESSEPRRHRRMSGSFSEEDIRIGKSSRKCERRSRPRCYRVRRRRSRGHLDRNGRARSLEEEESSRHEYDESRSDTNERYSEEEGRRERDKNNDQEIRTRRRRSRLRERSGSDESIVTSDDSLRVVVVVRKSLERTSESVRISKTPRRRETYQRERRVLSRERQARRRMNASETRQRSSTEHVTEGMKERSTVERTEANQSCVRNRDAVTDSTSQERVERVTVTALVHEDTMAAKATSLHGERDTGAVLLLASREDSDSSSEKIIREEEGTAQKSERSGENDTSRDSVTFAQLPCSESTPQDGNDTSRTVISSEQVDAIDDRDGREVVIETDLIITTMKNSETQETTANNEMSDGDKCTVKEEIKVDDGLAEDGVTDITNNRQSIDLEQKSDDRSADPPSQADSVNEAKANEDPEKRDSELPAETPEDTQRDEISKTGGAEGREYEHQSGNHTSGDEYCSDPSAIVAVIDDPAWDDTEDESELVDAPRVPKVPTSTSEEETPGSLLARKRSVAALPDLSGRVEKESRAKDQSQQTPRDEGLTTTSRSEKQRRDSGGKDSGIEPSPRVSKIPKRTTTTTSTTMPRSYTERQRGFDAETVTRDVQISLRRYHLERKIFFQLMELKRLQIRHGRANERVLVKRQVEAFNKAGMSGPTLGVVKYDQPLTFRHFEAFLYDQLRRLQRRSASPDSCTEAKQCTRKTHRCHHATSAYTSMPVYAYLGGGGMMGQEREHALLPRIETQRGRGRMTVEVTRGEEKRIIALPQEQLDRTKRYYVTFTVRGERQQQPQQQRDDDERASSRGARRGSRDARRDAQSV